MHVFHCPTRWGDMDIQGHLNNVRYIDYLQEARVSYLLSGDNADMLGNGVLVAGHQMEYLAPVVHSDDLLIELAPQQVGAGRFSIGYHLSVAGRPVARAISLLAPFDLEANRARRLTPAEREHFRADEQSPGLELRPVPKVTIGDAAAHVFEFTVRWSDLDSYRHVNNVRFYDYLQEARLAMMGPAAERGADFLWLLVRQDVEYLAQLNFRTQPYQVRTAVQAIGNSSMTLTAEIVDPLDGTVFARGRSVVVCGDPATGRPIAVPPAGRELLEQYLVQG